MFCYKNTSPYCYNRKKSGKFHGNITCYACHNFNEKLDKKHKNNVEMFCYKNAGIPYCYNRKKLGKFHGNITCYACHNFNRKVRQKHKNNVEIKENIPRIIGIKKEKICTDNVSLFCFNLSKIGKFNSNNMICDACKHWHKIYKV